MKKIGDYLEIHALEVESSCVPEAGRGDRAIIRGYVVANTSVKVLYMASLELDNMEMHESFRLVFEPGENRCALPEVAVINPIRSSDEQLGNYKLTLKIYSAGGVVDEFSSLVRF